MPKQQLSKLATLFTNQQYIKGPAYKVSQFALSSYKSYASDLVIWGVAGAAAVATFTDGVPLFKETFYSKIPYFGDHWVHNPDPEDVPV